MADYKKMYLALFRAIADTIDILQKAQQETEDLYISADQPSLTVLNEPDTANDGVSKN